MPVQEYVIAEILTQNFNCTAEAQHGLLPRTCPTSIMLRISSSITARSAHYLDLMSGPPAQTPNKHASTEYLRFLKHQIPKTPKKFTSLNFPTPRRAADQSSSRLHLNRFHTHSEQQATQRKPYTATTASLKYLSLYNNSVSDFFSLKYDDIDACAGSQSRCNVSGNCMIFEDDDIQIMDAESGESRAESRSSLDFNSAPGTLWTAEEKDIFYRCLSRYSIHRIECFSAHLPEKSQIEISSFYDVLQKELLRRKRRRLVKVGNGKQCWITYISAGFPYKCHPQAVEISQRSIENEEQQCRLINDDEKLWDGLESWISSPERFVDYEKLNLFSASYLSSTSKLLLEAYILLEELLGQRIRQLIAHLVADRPIVSGMAYFETSDAPTKRVLSDNESSDESTKNEVKPTRKRRRRGERSTVSFEAVDGAVTERDIWAASRDVFGGMQKFGDILAVLKLRHPSMKLQSSQSVSSEVAEETSTAVLSVSESLSSETDSTKSPSSLEDSGDSADELQRGNPELLGQSVRNKILWSWAHPIDKIAERSVHETRVETSEENASKNNPLVINEESKFPTQIDSSEEVEQALVDLETRMLERFDAAYARRFEGSLTYITPEIHNPLKFLQKTIDRWGLSYNEYTES